MSDEGEWSEDESKIGSAKRKRPSSPPRNQSSYDRSQRFGGVIEDWRACMRDDEISQAAYEVRLRREEERFDSRSFQSDSEASSWQGNDRHVGEPQAMSTKRYRESSPYIPPARTSRNNDVARSNANLPNWSRNTSMSSNPKMFKVEPFPKSVKPTDQLQEWTLWLSNFRMAVEKAGIVDQRARAIDLSLHIGDEMRRIIVGKDMFPPEQSVDETFPFYDRLVESLDEHFRGLTDESVDVKTFNTMKQGDSETALEYEFRLRQMAKRANETNLAMIRTRYIDGMRDKDLAERAFVEGISFKDVVMMATRKEAIASTKKPDFSPWGGEPIAVSAIANVEPRQVIKSETSRDWTPSRPRVEPREWIDRRPRFRRAQPAASGSFRRPDSRRPNAFENSSRCPKCGISQHRSTQCPADNSTCFNCGETGHFRQMCRKQVASIIDSTEANDKVQLD